MGAETSETLSIVIPVFNEEANIVPLCERLFPVLKKIGKPFEVIFVDDGSTDGTFDALLEISKTTPGLKAVSLFYREFFSF